MIKKDLVKLVSTNTTWLSKKQHEELKSNLKVKFKHLNLKGSFLKLIFDDKKKGCHVSDLLYPEGFMVPPKKAIEVGDEIVGIKRATYNNVLKDFNQKTVDILFENKFDHEDDDLDFFPLQNLENTKIQEFLSTIEPNSYVNLKYVRKTKDKQLVSNILRLTERWEDYCSSIRDQLRFKIDLMDLKLSFFEGYPDISEILDK